MPFKVQEKSKKLLIKLFVSIVGHFKNYYCSRGDKVKYQYLKKWSLKQIVFKWP